MPYRPQPDDMERLVVALWGDKKTGKTHCAFTFPQPIYLINTDHGFRELLHKFPGLDIQVEDICEDPSAGALGSFEAAQPALARFHETYMAWIAELKDHPGTIVIDNASFLWDLVQYVKLEEAKRERFGKQSKTKNLEELRDSRFDYGPVNHYYNVMMRAIYNTRGSLVLTHSVKNKYDERGQELPQLQMQGFRGTGGIVQAVCQTYKVGDEFRMVVNHSRHAPEQEGLWTQNTYSKLRDLLFG